MHNDWQHLSLRLSLLINPEVKKYIDQYLENPEKTRELIGLSKVYFPIIEKALRSQKHAYRPEIYGDGGF
jgi:hypothetical protein